MPRLSQLIDGTHTRRSIYNLPPGSAFQMVETARVVRASAKFAGSGGAIIDLYSKRCL